MVTVPTSIDEITPTWLTGALQERFPGIEVSAVDIDDVLDGTATKVLARLTYGGVGRPDGAPTSVCVKGGFKENASLMAATGIYEREATFYHDIAPKLPASGTVAWWAGADSASRLGVIVLDDLRAASATFRRATSPMTVDEAAEGLSLIAGYHAATWNSPILHSHPAIDCYVTRNNLSGHYFATMDAERVAYFLALPLRGAAIPQQLHRPQYIVDLFWRWVDQNHAGPWVLTHGDAHIGNWFQRPDGTLGLVDWQTMCRMRCAHDVAYFVGSALDTADRRRSEQDLIREYLARISAGGIDGPSFDDLWLDYRRHMAFGLMAWLTSLEWMNPEEIHAAAVGRFAHAVIDLESDAALA